MKRLAICLTLIATSLFADDATYISTLTAGEPKQIDMRVWGRDGGNRHIRTFFETPMTFLVQRVDGENLTPADLFALQQIVPTCPRGYIRDLNMHAQRDAMETTFICRGTSPVRTSGNPLPIPD